MPETVELQKVMKKYEEKKQELAHLEDAIMKIEGELTELESLMPDADEDWRPKQPK